MPIVPIEKVPQEALKDFSMNNDEEELDKFEQFLKEQAIEYNRQLYSSSYVYLHKGIVKGYISICAASIKQVNIKKMFEITYDYNQFPAILIGKLAVDRRYRKDGIGSKLFEHAMKKIFYSIDRVSARFLIVHSIKKEEAMNFYKKMKFIPLTENERTVTMAIDLREMILNS